jgi:hypothetical protein
VNIHSLISLVVTNGGNRGITCCSLLLPICFYSPYPVFHS